jgi:hypothetical protein
MSRLSDKLSEEIGCKSAQIRELEKPQITPIFADSNRPRDGKDRP